MNLTQTHLKMVRDSLIAYRRSIMHKATPVGQTSEDTNDTERFLTPAIQHRLNEVKRVIKFLDDEIVDSTSDDSWSLENN